MEHKRKRGMLGSIGDLFDGPTGIGDALGLGLGDSANGAIELVAAGAAGALSIKAVGYVEANYGKIPVVGAQIVSRPWVTPVLRVALGVGAAVGMEMVKFPGSKAIGTGTGVALVASGALDLIGIAQQKIATAGADLKGVDGSPIYIREGGRMEQLNGLPLRVREVPASELALGNDMAYLQ